mmetsp:Transcript_52637/g.58860  ORF Transcript_52637/g.58860 Transcript_52637/m.58860 type:complete len:192 (-) Transcript_52637:63-638(-)
MISRRLSYVQIKSSMNYSKDDDEDLPLSHPARRNKNSDKNGGGDGCGGGSNGGAWQGREMEIVHQRETERRDRKNNNKSTSTVAAVDLNQFRNTEVGKGYQAKHVVRQATTVNNRTNNTAQIMHAETIKTTTATTKRSRIRGNDDDDEKRRRKEYNNADDTTKLVFPEKEELLRNYGLRAFRREIENILSQ